MTKVWFSDVVHFPSFSTVSVETGHSLKPPEWRQCARGDLQTCLRASNFYRNLIAEYAHSDLSWPYESCIRNYSD